MEKRGQGLGILVPAIMTLSLGVIILIFGLIISQEVYDETLDETTTITNETLTTVEETGETMAGTGCGSKDFAVSTVYYNVTGTTQLVNSGNYTVIKESGKIKMDAEPIETPWNNSNWNVTYTVKYGKEACRSGNETMVGLGKYGDYWDLIVLAVIIAVVISLLMVIMSTRKIR